MPRAALLLITSLLLVACGGTQKNTTPRFAPIADDVADEGDHEGTIKAFERRLDRLQPSDPDHPPTLERLALAHLEHADALRAEAEAAAQPEPLLERSNEQRDAAIARFEELARLHPDYEGVPAGLLIVAHEHHAAGDAAARDDALARLTPLSSEYALDGLILQGEVAFQNKRLSDAMEAFDAVRTRAPDSPRAHYAHYMQGWLHHTIGDAELAVAAVQGVLDAKPESAELNERALKALVLFSADLELPPDDARARFSPYARDEDELDQMLIALGQLYRERGLEDLADAYPSPSE